MLLVSGLIALAGCPDRNSPERKARMAVSRFEAFTKQMCACKDKPCADKVQEELTTWSTEMAKDSSLTDRKPDEATMKEMTDLATRYSECFTKLVVAGETLPPPRDDVPTGGTIANADVLLRDARAWARAKHPDHHALGVTIAYADASGDLDAKHGTLDITFGRLSPKADDPTRKIGAPVERPQPPSDCFQLGYTPASRWLHSTYACGEAFDVTNRCSVAQIWERAIERGAPAEALASITFRTTSDGGVWALRITDEPRDIHIVETFNDDCPLAVEK